VPKAYLTIDDSPSARFTDLVEFLAARKIPALLFMRGDLLEGNMAVASWAVEQGFALGNHGYAHIAAGELGFERWCDDFEKTERLIDLVYECAGQQRDFRTYRFPYIDRGDGVRVERAAAQGKTGGEGNAITDHSDVRRIQDYLKQRGVRQPFTNMPADYPSAAADSLFTYTSGDWMLTARHKGKWDYKTLDDLKARIDNDARLQDESVHHVLLMHDQAEIHNDVCALIDYMCDKDFKFLDFGSKA